MSTSDRVYSRHLVRNSKLIDDDDVIQLTPLWTAQQYIFMNDAFCQRMKTAIENGRELPRENKLW